MTPFVQSKLVYLCCASGLFALILVMVYKCVTPFILFYFLKETYAMINECDPNIAEW